LHTRDLREMGGLWSRIAWLPAITLFFSAASLGLPGLGNFVGEFLILLGAYEQYPLVVAVATIGLVFAVVYSLRLVQKAFFGRAAGQAQEAQSGAMIEALTAREFGLMLLLMAALLFLGLYPQPVLNVSELPMQWVADIYTAVAE